jgi:hypothetical protein
MKQVQILGTTYTVVYKDYNDDPFFKNREWSGYCSGARHLIVICNMRTYPGWEHETESAAEYQQRKTLRHEVVHAFLNESGLSSSSNGMETWATVDWFAAQGPKICRVWKQLGCL